MVQQQFIMVGLLFYDEILPQRTTYHHLEREKSEDNIRCFICRNKRNFRLYNCGVKVYWRKEFRSQLTFRFNSQDCDNSKIKILFDKVRIFYIHVILFPHTRTHARANIRIRARRDSYNKSNQIKYTYVNVHVHTQTHTDNGSFFINAKTVERLFHKFFFFIFL